MPPAPQTPGPVPQNGLGTAALVLGILQFFCLGPIGGILALIMGRIGMTKAKQELATNGGVAKAGFILGLIGVILWVISIIVGIIVISIAASKDNVTITNS